MTNHEQHAKQPNPDGRAARLALRRRRRPFIAGPFQESRRNLRSQGYVLVDGQDEDGKRTKTWKLRKRLRGMGFTKKPSSRRLLRKELVKRITGRDNVVDIETARRGPEKHGPDKRKSLWGRIKDTAKQFFSGRQRGRG